MPVFVTLPSGIRTVWREITDAALVNYQLHGAELSAKRVEVVRRMLKGETVTQDDTGLFPREWRELRAFLQLD